MNISNPTGDVPTNWKFRRFIYAVIIFSSLYVVILQYKGISRKIPARIKYKKERCMQELLKPVSITKNRITQKDKFEFDRQEDANVSPYTLCLLNRGNLPFNRSVRYEKESLDYANQRNKFRNDVTTKKISWVNVQKHSWILEGTECMNFNICEFKNCMVDLETKNPSSDVIIFGKVPKHKPIKEKKQIWTFFNLESPYSIPKIPKEWQFIFDWTMTYRLDSDIYIPYNVILRDTVTDTAISKTVNVNNLKEKTKLAVWATSHCSTDSKREIYVKKLKEKISVDIYGSCGNKSIRNISQLELYRTLSKQYKFYLSFENALCTDYITEKAFFLYFSDIDMVPIVRGRGSYRHVLPAGTYIDTNNFKNISHLAMFLKYLNQNEEEYNKYILRKREYVALSQKQALFYSYCEICRKINLEEYKEKSFKFNIQEWIFNKTCLSPTDLI